ncbi:hypothetical protein HK405_015563, partial [Cladochytrium tenue]
MGEAQEPMHARDETCSRLRHVEAREFPLESRAVSEAVFEGVMRSLAAPAPHTSHGDVREFVTESNFSSAARQ